MILSPTLKSKFHSILFSSQFYIDSTRNALNLQVKGKTKTLPLQLSTTHDWLP